MTYKYLVLCILYILISTYSCTPEKDTNKAFEIAPNSVRSSEAIYIKKTEGTFSSKSNLIVSIGEKNARILSTTSTGLLKVLVPKIKTSIVDVKVSENNQQIGSEKLNILDSSSEQLLLKLDPNGNLELLERKENNSIVSYQFATDDIQLNYDLIDQNQNVIFSSSIAHPQKMGVEIFDDPEGRKIHRTQPKLTSMIFSIQIPKSSNAIAVRFYEANQGVDLADQEGRKERIPLSEINLR